MAKLKYDIGWQLVRLVTYVFDIHTQQSLPIYINILSFVYHHNPAEAAIKLNVLKIKECFHKANRPRQYQVQFLVSKVITLMDPTFMTIDLSYTPSIMLLSQGVSHVSCCNPLCKWKIQDMGGFDENRNADLWIYNFIEGSFFCSGWFLLIEWLFWKLSVENHTISHDASGDIFITYLALLNNLNNFVW